MEFEWDEAKNRRNIEKHGIDFADAQRAFNGPTITREDKRRDYGEVRFQTIGWLDAALVILVVHTDRMGRTRIISARPAKRHERDTFKATLQKTADS